MYASLLKNSQILRKMEGNYSFYSKSHSTKGFTVTLLERVNFFRVFNFSSDITKKGRKANQVLIKLYQPSGVGRIFGNVARLKSTIFLPLNSLSLSSSKSKQLIPFVFTVQESHLTRHKAEKMFSQFQFPKMYTLTEWI